MDRPTPLHFPGGAGIQPGRWIWHQGGRGTSLDQPTGLRHPAGTRAGALDLWRCLHRPTGLRHPAGAVPWRDLGGAAQSRRLWRAYTVEAGGRPAGAVVAPWRGRLAPGRRLWIWAGSGTRAGASTRRRVGILSTDRRGGAPNFAARCASFPFLYLCNYVPQHTTSNNRYIEQKQPYNQRCTSLLLINV